MFRLVPALLVGVVVVLGALTSRELGGSRGDQVGTAVALAGSATVIGTGHLFSTTTFDLAFTTACLLLLIRAVSAPGRLGRWVALGVVTAVALEVKTRPATVLACCGVGLAVAGPRSVLRRPGPWIAAGLALLGAVPDLVWQTAHGWPQLALARAIAAGSSGTSVSRALVVPLQLLLTGPVLAVPFVVGLVTLLRGSTWRWLGVGYLAMLAFVVVTGGKPYYLLGFVPVLLAAGVPRVLAWLRRARWRPPLAVALLAVNAVIVAVIALPVVPVARLASTPVVDINYDAGETVGWDAFTRTVSTAAAGLSPAERAGLVVLTGNYGEAGALDRARRRGTALPPVYSGHNAYGLGGRRRASRHRCCWWATTPTSPSSPAAGCSRASTTAWGSTTTSRERRSAGAPRPPPRGRPSGHGSASSADPLHLSRGGAKAQPCRTTSGRVVGPSSVTTATREPSGAKAAVGSAPSPTAGSRTPWARRRASSAVSSRAGKAAAGRIGERQHLEPLRQLLEGAGALEAVGAHPGTAQRGQVAADAEARRRGRAPAPARRCPRAAHQDVEVDDRQSASSPRGGRASRSARTVTGRAASSTSSPARTRAYARGRRP